MLPLDIFWTSLILLDAGVVALLVAGYRRQGLLAALIVMALDVAANSYALFAMGIHAFAAPLVQQAVFFGFILGSIGFIWPKPEPATGQVKPASYPPRRQPAWRGRRRA